MHPLPSSHVTRVLVSTGPLHVLGPGYNMRRLLCDVAGEDLRGTDGSCYLLIYCILHVFSVAFGLHEQL